MKSKEFLSEQNRPISLDPGIAAKRIAGRIPSGMSGFDAETQKIFLSNFLSNATTALMSAIKTGLVDPNAESDIGPETPNTPAQTSIDDNPPDNTPGTSTQNQPPPAPPSGVAQPVQAQEPQQPQKPAGDMNDVIASLTSLGYKNKQIKKVLPRLNPGNSTEDNIRLALQYLSRPQDNVVKFPGSKRPTDEPLNEIFEQIISLMEQAETLTIAQFIENWFNKYMRGSGVNSEMGGVRFNQIAKEIEQAYQQEQKAGGLGKMLRGSQPRGKTNDAIKKLGELAYAVYHSSARAGMASGGGSGGNTGGDGTKKTKTDTDAEVADGSNVEVLSKNVHAAVAQAKKFTPDVQRKVVNTFYSQLNYVPSKNQITQALSSGNLSVKDLEDIENTLMQLINSKKQSALNI